MLQHAAPASDLSLGTRPADDEAGHDGRAAASQRACSSPAISPWALYAALLELTNQMQTLDAKASMRPKPPYDHNDVMKVLFELETHLLSLSEPDGGVKTFVAEFAREGEWLKCRIPEEFFVNGREWHLGLRSSLSEDAVRSRVQQQHQFKVMPGNPDPLRRATYGWAVTPDLRPAGLNRDDPGMNYFKFSQERTEAWVRNETHTGRSGSNGPAPNHSISLRRSTRLRPAVPWRNHPTIR